VVVAAYDNATYILRELDGTMLKIPVVRKQIKTFRRRDGRFCPDDVVDFETYEVDEIEKADLKTGEDRNLHESEEE
jgi:DNA repair ATPase RecN